MPEPETVRPETMGWRTFVLDPTPPQRRAEDSMAAETVLVEAALRFVILSGRIDPHAQRDLGRALGAKAMKGHLTLQATLDALPRLGVGHVEHEHMSPGRHRFSSDDLVLPPRHAKGPACALVLGLVEGLVSGLGEGAALGTEVACRAQGSPACVFVVSER